MKHIIPLIALVALSATAQDRFTLPDGFTIEKVTTPDLTSYPMFMNHDDRGRLYIAESTGKDISGKEMQATPECQILRLVDEDGDGVYDTRTVFADTLSLPMGVLWHQGSVYVASPPEFLRFDDTDDDGIADSRTVLHTGWNVFNTASLHGPFLGPDGRLYLTHGRHGYDITTQEGERLQGLASRIWRTWPDGSGLERFAGGGFDNPVELVFLPNGDMIGTMTYFTDPKFGQRDALMHWIHGGVYPKLHDSTKEFTRTGPDLMPVMSKFSRIAPSGLERYDGDGFGPGYDGILFSAQFNPHRIQQHRLIPDGATYRTEDTDFLNSNDPDFYPTDVLQDADGSLLISDTGAWYVDACPVSRIAKPEVKGGIYRIRRTNAEPVKDPWGLSINWDTQSPDELVSLLDDTRLKVRSRAMARLIKSGSDAITPIATALQSDKPRTRLLAVTALRQIDATERIPLLRQALANSTDDVRVAAIHAVADHDDDGAASTVARMLSSQSPTVVRAAASTLGRLGHAPAIPQLLDAAATDDPFLKHAITYALIEINEPDALHEFITANPGSIDISHVAALIALDQLGDSRVTAQHALALITSDNENFTRTGLWIASRHDAFAPELMTHLRSELQRPDFTPTENIRQTLIAYANLDSLQQAVAATLADNTINSDTRAFLLETINQMPLTNLPQPWLSAIDILLQYDTDSTLRWTALDLIQTKSITALDETLLTIAGDTNEDTAFRLAALSAAAPRLRTLPDDTFKWVLGVIGADAPATWKQAAVRVLSRTELTTTQLFSIAKLLLPEVEAQQIAPLTGLFTGGTDEELGLALVGALEYHSAASEMVTPSQLTSVLAGYPQSVHNAAEPILSAMQSRDTENIARFIALEAKLGTGDVGRGRRIFFGEAAACSTCHAIATDGGDFGPDLTTIGEVRTGHDLLEAVMFPNSSFVPDFAPYQIETDDDVHMGLVERETEAGVTLRIDPQTRAFIPRGDITAMHASPVSLMPEGLDAALTNEELIDLVTFLQTLDGNSFLEVARH